MTLFIFNNVIFLFLNIAFLNFIIISFNNINMKDDLKEYIDLILVSFKECLKNYFCYEGGKEKCKFYKTKYCRENIFVGRYHFYEYGIYDSNAFPTQIVITIDELKKIKNLSNL